MAHGSGEFDTVGSANTATDRATIIVWNGDDRMGAAAAATIPSNKGVRAIGTLFRSEQGVGAVCHQGSDALNVSFLESVLKSDFGHFAPCTADPVHPGVAACQKFEKLALVRCPRSVE